MMNMMMMDPQAAAAASGGGGTGYPPSTTTPLPGTPMAYYPPNYYYNQQPRMMAPPTTIPHSSYSYPHLEDNTDLLVPTDPAIFPTTSPTTRFFVLKSHTEDHIYTSIREGVWTSTEENNYRLDR